MWRKRDAAGKRSVRRVLVPAILAGFAALTLFQLPTAQRLWIWLVFPETYYDRTFFTDVSRHEHTACPDEALVILTGGQSNAANSVSAPTKAEAGVSAFQWYDGACYRLGDPLLGVTGARGSLWSALGRDIARERPVIFVNTAVGATSYRAWLDWRSGYFRRMQAAVAAMSLQGLEPDLVLWHQGESDAGRQAPFWVYRRDLGWLMRKLQDVLPDATIVLYQVSRCFGPDGEPALRDAQAFVAGQSSRILLGPDTDLIEDPGRSDGCHFNASGRDEVVAETVAFMKDNRLLPGPRNPEQDP